MNENHAESSTFNRHMSSIYQEKGFKDRKDYLDSLCEDYDSEVVFVLADIYGPGEDFDGLLTSLEDYSI